MSQEHHTEDYADIRDAVAKLCSQFPGEYWRKLDREMAYPKAFVDALTEAGYLSVLIPEEYGGAGLKLSAAAAILEEIQRAGCNGGGCHAQMYTMGTVLRHGNDEQKAKYLPKIASGELRLQAFGVTEPTSGTDTSSLKTFARKDGNDSYIVNGQKVWISTAQVANKILLLARTTPLEEVRSPTHGLSLFYTDFDRNRIKVHEIEKMGRKIVDSNELFFEDFEIPMEDRIGEEGKGFEYILEGMNPERILIAAEAVGLGKLALSRATEYAKTRVVFNRPIGKNQGIQHPLAVNWVELEAAWLMVMSAAWQYDKGMPCGAAANAAKYLAGEAGFSACEQAVMTHGGFGYAKEFHVERYLREVLIPRIAPVSPQLALSFIAEKVLGLAKSY